MSYPQTTFSQTKLSDDSLLGLTRRVAWNSTIPLQLNILKETGRYDAFELKHKECYNDEPDHWPVPNHLFWDSDIGKWIEGACYFLQEYKDERIEAAVHELVEMIREAQQSDGYLNIHFTVVAPDQRFANLRDLHELYNAGHLIEGALAHENLYGNGRLLEPILKYVDLFCNIFGPGEKQMHGYPGHPEIELALLRLYAHTKDARHLELARYFIDERGNPKGSEGRHFYDVEAEKRGERPYERPGYYPQKRSYWYQQAHLPIIEQREIVGHSVRAMYLLTAVADLMIIPEASRQSGVDYSDALTALWDNMVQRKMSVTGGIGAMKQWEGFGIDYFLPQSTEEGGCYNETCASIGIMLLANRMLQLDRNHKYADVMELALYNTVLTGMSRDGKRFTYVNQLGSSDQDLSKREDWFTCACCPPNVSRLLASLGGYVWDANVDDGQDQPHVAINVHLFTSATLSVSTGKGDVKLVQKTNYPWSGDVDFSLEAPDELDVSIWIRVPGWAGSHAISPKAETTQKGGYMELSPTYLKSHRSFTFSLPLDVRTISQPLADPLAIAVARGPLVYCAEDQDNKWVKDHFKSVHVDWKSTAFSEEARDDGPDGEHYISIKATGGVFVAQVEESAMPGMEQVQYKPLEAAVAESSANELQFVPYYLRANRGGRGQMRVALKKLVS